MNTGSAAIKFIIGLFSKLNYYFEYSFIYKMLSAIGNAGRSSFVVKSFKYPKNRDYLGGSLLFKPILLFLGILFTWIKKLYSVILSANRTSLNKKLFDNIIMPLKKADMAVSAISITLMAIFGVLCVFNINSVIGIIFGVLAIICLIALLNPGLIATAFKTCAPVKFAKWFFTEN